MKLETHAVLLVKLFDKQRYQYPKFLEYRLSKGRNLILVQNWLRTMEYFKYAVIFEYHRASRQRGTQVGFITRDNIDY